MSKKTCRDCLHCSIEGANEVYCSGMPWHYPFGGSDIVTLDKGACEHFLERDKPTVFHRITQSPEVLAPKLVYSTYIKIKKPLYDWKRRQIANRWVLRVVWGSSVTDETYSTKAEAIAITVEKLRETEK